MATITAREVAQELRRIAEALDREPERTIPNAYVAFMAYDRETFVNLARVMPRPFTKKVTEGSYPQITLTYSAPAASVIASAPRDKTCRIIKPAVPAEYDCDPILSEADEEEVEVAAS